MDRHDFETGCELLSLATPGKWEGVPIIAPTTWIASPEARKESGEPDWIAKDVKVDDVRFIIWAQNNMKELIELAWKYVDLCEDY